MSDPHSAGHNQPGAARATPEDFHSEDFPYDEIDARLNQQARESDDAKVEARAREIASQLLGEYIVWLLRRDIPNAQKGRPYCIKRIGKRVIASAWVLRPDQFEGKSLRSIAKIPAVQSQRSQLSEYVLEFSDRFGFRGRGQKSERAREIYSTLHKRQEREQPDPSRN